ncbi:MAG: hemolysin-like protein [Rhodospirillaceae bacterium]|nr:hemolysin-like protein [Rhodospirillaceae bacterium]
MTQSISQSVFDPETTAYARAAAEFAIEKGSLAVRLARNWDEIDAALSLRYRIFYEEMEAQATAEMALRKRDFDQYDEFADHLLVLDKELGDGPESVVGTYRLIRRDAAQACGTFYSSDEYDIDVLTALPDEILELGRSCVDAAYRDRRVINLLWDGIAAYCVAHDIRIMFGCASLPGCDPDALKLPLSYLYHHHLAPAEIRPRAVPARFVDMNRISVNEIDRKAGLKSVPPLIKGYLRIGGFVGDGVVIDEQFNTTDVCIVVQTKLITDKYARHFERDGSDLHSI